MSLKAPFPWFGGKSGAAGLVWSLLGVDSTNYVEPFAGSAAMLLLRGKIGHTETINDKDGFVANFWRGVAIDAAAVAAYADWPTNELDLTARHSWLVRRSDGLAAKLEADPLYFDAQIAGWWCWGLCNWIGSGWCDGHGPWVHDGERLTRVNAGRGINRKLPHLGDAGRGINRQLPHLGNAGQGGYTRSDFIFDWFAELGERLRNVRVACGDWRRVLADSVTTRHGDTAIFLDPPYTLGAMDYAAGGVGGSVANDVRAWCIENGNNKLLRIVLCGHRGEHDELLNHGWTAHGWQARTGYAQSKQARVNTDSETVWSNASCNKLTAQKTLFDNPAHGC